MTDSLIKSPPETREAKAPLNVKRLVVMGLAVAALYGDGLLLWALHLHGTGILRK